MKGVILAIAAVAAAAVLLNRSKPVSGRTASGVNVLLPSPSSGLIQGVDYDIDPDTGSVVLLRQSCGCHRATKRLLLRHSGFQAVYATPMNQSRSNRNFYDTNQGERVRDVSIAPGGGIATVFRDYQDPRRRPRLPRLRGLGWNKITREPREPVDPMSRSDIFGGQTRLR